MGDRDDRMKYIAIVCFLVMAFIIGRTIQPAHGTEAFITICDKEHDIERLIFSFETKDKEIRKDLIRKNTCRQYFTEFKVMNSRVYYEYVILTVKHERGIGYSFMRKGD